MIGYTIRRCLLFIPVILGVIVVAFALIHIIPGDPARVLLGETATEQQIAQVRADLGLDQPLPQQFIRYATHLAHGDLGQSLFQSEAVSALILERVPATLELAAGALLVSVVLGVPLGVAAAVNAHTPIDTLCIIFSQLGVALTVFWLAVVLVYVFSVELHWLPAIGRGTPLLEAIAALVLRGRFAPLGDALTHLLLPSLAMGLQGAALICRMVRGSLLERLGSNFVRTARAMGLPERRVIWRHAVPNALLPVITVIGLQFGNLLSGAVLVEGVFGWPGLGQLAVGALSRRDLPLVQGIALIIALLFGLINLATDMAYALIDPRIGRS
jgi:peptide/nickel transport system permease protein